jgi:hypothetical protein
MVLYLKKWTRKTDEAQKNPKMDEMTFRNATCTTRYELYDWIIDV